MGEGKQKRRAFRAILDSPATPRKICAVPDANVLFWHSCEQERLYAGPGQDWHRSLGGSGGGRGSKGASADVRMCGCGCESASLRFCVCACEVVVARRLSSTSKIVDPSHRPPFVKWDQRRRRPCPDRPDRPCCRPRRRRQSSHRLRLGRMPSLPCPCDAPSARSLLACVSHFCCMLVAGGYGCWSRPTAHTAVFSSASASVAVLRRRAGKAARSEGTGVGASASVRVCTSECVSVQCQCASVRVGVAGRKWLGSNWQQTLSDSLSLTFPQEHRILGACIARLGAVVGSGSSWKGSVSPPATTTNHFATSRNACAQQRWWEAEL